MTPLKLNEKDQCPVCKKKPIKYTSYWSTSDGPHYFCSRCDRAYDLVTQEQIANFHYNADGSLKRREQ